MFLNPDRQFKNAKSGQHRERVPGRINRGDRKLINLNNYKGMHEFEVVII